MSLQGLKSGNDSFSIIVRRLKIRGFVFAEQRRAGSLEWTVRLEGAWWQSSEVPDAIMLEQARILPGEASIRAGKISGSQCCW